MMILYDFGNSVCCQKVRITLVEKGLTWQAHRVDLFKSEQYDPEYLKLNPKGVVPTLVHNGTAIIESTLICEYIDETFPDPPLIPKAPAERTRMRLWSKFVDEGVFDATTELSFSAMFRERMRNLPPEIREKRFRNVGDPRRTDRFKSTYEHGVQSPFVLHGIAAFVSQPYAQVTDWSVDVLHEDPSPGPCVCIDVKLRQSREQNVAAPTRRPRTEVFRTRKAHIEFGNPAHV